MALGVQSYAKNVTPSRFANVVFEVRTDGVNCTVEKPRYCEINVGEKLFTWSLVSGVKRH